MLEHESEITVRCPDVRHRCTAGKCIEIAMGAGQHRVEMGKIRERLVLVPKQRSG